MTTGNLVPRQKYLEDILSFRDTDLIKVITGVRRCGKSTLLSLVKSHIEAEGINDRTFIELNLESKSCSVMSEDDLYNYVASHVSKTGKTYIFLDEPQRIAGWQNSVNAMRVDFDCDIYITGSNAYLLSSELSTYLSGRYIEIETLPLVFSEYLDFCNISFKEGSSVALDVQGNPVSFDDIFERYMRFGGFPAIASLDINQKMHSQYLSSVYDAVVVRDILNRERRGNSGFISNPELLESMAAFLADNIGNVTSANKIAGTLSSAGNQTTNKTASQYLAALCDAFLFYPSTRYDLRGRDTLKTNPKYYIVDVGLRSMLMGYRFVDLGRIFENLVYLQLRYLGYAVHVGKLYNQEIDFVVEKDGRRIYIQATDEMFSEATKERELKPLRSIKDSYQKVIICRQGSNDADIDGIQIIKAKDFFLHGCL